MNFSTAANYLQLGYKIKRSVWKDYQYLIVNDLGLIWQNYINAYYSFDNKQLIKRSKHMYQEYFCRVQDLIAEDWEVITDNIINYFGKNGIEYSPNPEIPDEITDI